MDKSKVRFDYSVDYDKLDIQRLYTCIVYKDKKPPENFICHANPKNVSELFNISKEKAYQYSKYYVEKIIDEVKCEIMQREILILALEKRLESYQNQTPKKIRTLICANPKCQKVFQTKAKNQKFCCERCGFTHYHLTKKLKEGSK